jgi:peptidyl-prolyl cis-trans isomerase-like 4
VHSCTSYIVPPSGPQARFFHTEINKKKLKHKIGSVCMAGSGPMSSASQFYICMTDDADYLDGQHTVFGEIAEGLEVCQRINDALVDDTLRPLQNIRIRHTILLGNACNCVLCLFLLPSSSLLLAL